ncbi:MAG: cellulase family glycosylhydrolase, partial [Myxococcales bacterium]|nr:cellulase family glycosylhydrolase [Myxococcales bacterium]
MVQWNPATRAVVVAALAAAAAVGCSNRHPTAQRIDGLGTPSMLPPGPLSTSGRNIVDQSGNAVRIAGTAYWIGDPANDLPKIAAAGFNAIRVAWVNRTLDSSWNDLDATVAAAGKAGVRVILDNHDNEGQNAPCWAQQANGLWYDLGGATDGTDGCGIAGTVTRDGWVTDWARVAQHFAGNDTVIGYDLKNEPLEYGPGVTWGDGNRDRDLRWAYEDAGNAILAADPGKLVICEGPQNYSDTFAHLPGVGAPWGDLTGVKAAPVHLNVPNKVVYSVHDYPTHVSAFSPDSGQAKDDMAEKAFGYVATDGIAPLYIGEWAADNLPGGDQAFADDFVAFYNDPKHGPASTSYWMWGIDYSCDSCGIIDWNGNPRAAQMAYVQKLMFYPTTTTTPPPPPATSVRIAVGHTSPVTDSAGNVWSADSNSSGGSSFSNSPPLPIANSDDAELYNGERYGADDGGKPASFRYTFALKAGSYAVTLKFAEYYVTAAGQRQFDVAINGNKVLAGFDIFAAAAGANKAVDKSFPLTLSTDGQVTIEFAPGAAQNPKVDAISILPGTVSTGGAPLVVPPLPNAQPGQWQQGDLSAAGMTMHYDYLLPHGYDPSHSYPLVLWLHENDMGDPYYDNGQAFGLAGYLDGWYNNAQFRSQYPCILVAPYADQRSDPGGETSNFGGWTPPGDRGPNEDAAVAIAQYFMDHYSVYKKKVYVTGASLGGIGSWAMMLDYNAVNGPYGHVFAAGLPLAGVIERYGFGVNPPNDVVDRMRNVPVFAVHGAGDGTSQPNWDRAMWQDFGGGAFPGAPGAGAPSSSFRYLEDASLGHDVWDTYYA